MNNLTDKQAFDAFPKYNWVYQTPRVLDAQQIKWSLFQDETFIHPLPALNIEGSKDEIFIETPIEEYTCTDVLISKGDLKWTSTEIEGNVKLKLYAILSAHFTKFSGLIHLRHTHDMILTMSLSVTQDQFIEYPKDVRTKLNKMYHNV